MLMAVATVLLPGSALLVDCVAIAWRCLGTAQRVKALGLDVTRAPLFRTDARQASNHFRKSARTARTQLSGERRVRFLPSRRHASARCEGITAMKLSKWEGWLIKSLRNVAQRREDHEPVTLTITLSRGLIQVGWLSQGFQGNGEGATFDQAYQSAWEDQVDKYGRAATGAFAPGTAGIQ